MQLPSFRFCFSFLQSDSYRFRSPSFRRFHAGKIRAAKTLTCGINIDEPEYTLADAHGNYAVFDADFCKAVAVAGWEPTPGSPRW